jgi:hypothetical protein
MNSNVFKPVTVNNFLSNEECSFLVNFAKTTDKWRKIPGNFWDGRTLNYIELNGEVKNIFHRSIVNIQEIMMMKYELEMPIYPDTMDLVRWYDLMEQQPHCDDMNDNKQEHLKFSHRFFGCIIYLNDDYDGGRTYYPEHNFEIIPEAGKLAIHLGDCNHRHGVTQIKGNTRYTIASFWTFDKSKAISNIEYKYS